MFKLFFAFILIFSSLHSQEEKWSAETVKVGEIVSYEFSHPDIPSDSLEVPAKGTHPVDSDLPVLEILSIQEKGNKLIIQVRFLEVGEHVFPISWQTESGEKQKSDLKIKVLSNLTGSEFDVDDISEPIEFNGHYFLRLLGWTLVIFTVLGVLAYFILKWKRKPVFIKDANYEPISRGNISPKNENQLEKLLEREEIPHKEFVFLLSESVKERLGKRLKRDLQSYTNKELMDFIQKTRKISDLDKMKLENYLDMIKYMPNEEVISGAHAKKIYENWMEIIEV